MPRGSRRWRPGRPGARRPAGEAGAVGRVVEQRRRWPRSGSGCRSRPIRPTATARRSRRSRGCRRARSTIGIRSRDRGHELAGEHQVRAVADQHVHLALGRGELDARSRPGSRSPCTSSRTRRGSPCPRVAGAPQLVQVAGHRAGRADDHPVSPAASLTAPITSAWDGSGSARQRARPARVDLVAAHAAASASARAAPTPRRPGRPASASPELLERHARIAEQRQPALLRRVERGDVDVDEAHARVLERRVRRGREVAPARADADHQVGLARQPVRRRACRSRRPRPRLSGWSETSAPRPACVSETGIPVASTNARSAAVASL